MKLFEIKTFNSLLTFVFISLILKLPKTCVPASWGHLWHFGLNAEPIPCHTATPQNGVTHRESDNGDRKRRAQSKTTLVKSVGELRCSYLQQPASVASYALPAGAAAALWLVPTLLTCGGILDARRAHLSHAHLWGGVRGEPLLNLVAFVGGVPGLGPLRRARRLLALLFLALLCLQISLNSKWA